jgi:hypothetical protein
MLRMGTQLRDIADANLTKKEKEEIIEDGCTKVAKDLTSIKRSIVIFGGVGAQLLAKKRRGEDIDAVMQKLHNLKLAVGAIVRDIDSFEEIIPELAARNEK